MGDSNQHAARSGPLRDVKVVEIGGIGPGPFATMTLADMGADVIRIDRRDGRSPFPGDPRDDLLNRGKRSIELDLKSPADVQIALRLIDRADVVVEGFRPGVAERLGLGPETCLERNTRLVYGRMTGWGQHGPWAQHPGHDINYIALTGALDAIGHAGDAPTIPLNLVGDYGGGGMYLVAGVLAALHEVGSTGVGQIVDAAIVDGAAHLLTGTHAMIAAGAWVPERGENVLDGAAPHYNVYETADGKFMAVGAIEPQFYRDLLDRLGLDEDPELQSTREAWPALRERIAAIFASRTREEWEDVFDGSMACTSPVQSLLDAEHHPHLAARGTLVERDGRLQAAPAPRFSRTPTALGPPPPTPGQHSEEILAELGDQPE